jgi:anti-anti-sigma factor
MPDEDRQDGLTVRIEQSANATTIVLGGQLDLASIVTLDEAARTLEPVTRPLVVNVGKVTFIDSSGLRSLVAIHEMSLQATGVGARLVDVSPPVQRVLELTGLLDLFGVNGATAGDQ